MSLTILPDRYWLSYINDAGGNFTGIDLSDTQITTIGDSAFEGCEKLTTVTLPSTVATIDYQAFYDCDSLTSIDLSGCTSLTTIGQSAFERCDKSDNSHPAQHCDQHCDHHWPLCI